MLAVIFMQKAADIVALNFLRRTSEPDEDKILYLHFLKS